MWPSRLTFFTFGGAWGGTFNQPIADVVWPSSLKRLELPPVLNQPIKRVRWPASLQDLYFGANSSQSLTKFAWPDSLLSVQVGRRECAVRGNRER